MKIYSRSMKRYFALMQSIFSFQSLMLARLGEHDHYRCVSYNFCFCRCNCNPCVCY